MAYIEFSTAEAAQRSRVLNESLFKGRLITVLPKRKNVPNMGFQSRHYQQNAMQQQSFKSLLPLAAMMTAAMAGMAPGMSRGRGRGFSFGRGRGKDGRGRGAK